MKVKKFSLCGYPISLEIASGGAKIPILDRLDNPRHYRGPSEFDAIVNFGDLFVLRDMRGQRVPPEHRWSADNLPPQGITILELLDPEVAAIVQEISEVAACDFYDDKVLCQRYYDLNAQIFRRIARHTGVEPATTHFLGLIRAGVVAGKMLGVTPEDQVLIHTKRLHLKGEREGDIAVGITYVDPKQAERLDGQHVLIADPAGATLSSVVGNILFLVHRGVLPGRIDIWNTVTSHRGAVFATEAMRDLGLQGKFVSGGYSPGMDERYYLETESGMPSVRDAGDGLDRFLPEGLRLLPT